MTQGYAPVNGQQMYYEVHGTGRPLVLLHGGLMTIELSFGAVRPELAADRQSSAASARPRCSSSATTTSSAWSTRSRCTH